MSILDPAVRDTTFNEAETLEKQLAVASDDLETLDTRLRDAIRIGSRRCRLKYMRGCANTDFSLLGGLTHEEYIDFATSGSTVATTDDLGLDLNITETAAPTDGYVVGNTAVASISADVAVTLPQVVGEHIPVGPSTSLYISGKTFTTPNYIPTLVEFVTTNLPAVEAIHELTSHQSTNNSTQLTAGIVKVSNFIRGAAVTSTGGYFSLVSLEIGGTFSGNSEIAGYLWDTGYLGYLVKAHTPFQLAMATWSDPASQHRLIRANYDGTNITEIWSPPFANLAFMKYLLGYYWNGDQANNEAYRVTTTGVSITITGTNSISDADDDGTNIFIADWYGTALRKVAPAGPTTVASLVFGAGNRPMRVIVKDATEAYVAMGTSTGSVVAHKVNLGTMSISGTVTATPGAIRGMALSDDGATLYVLDVTGPKIYEIDVAAFTLTATHTPTIPNFTASGGIVSG